MALTPVEIRHIRLRKALFGYQVGQTDELLADVVTSFEDVWRDRADLADKIEQVEAELVRYRELEQLLRTTLISAERASQQMTDQTRRESDAVLEEARAEAREIVRGATAERERLNAEINQIRAQLSAVLATIGGELLAPEIAQAEPTVVAAAEQSAVPPDSPQTAPPAESQADVRSEWGSAPRAWPDPNVQPPTPRPQGWPGEQTGGQVMAGVAPMNGLRSPAPR
ncbi:MAG: DivIVA domain-containing protein [Gaiellaceae bacterium]|jgi:cell division initiation protein